MLEQNDFDFIELSGGTYEKLAFSNAHQRDSTKKRESFFLEFAEQIVPAVTKTRTYVTGGFKTVGAMVHALETVDGVGLARPVCQEPRLAKDILDGKVKGAMSRSSTKTTLASQTLLQVHKFDRLERTSNLSTCQTTRMWTLS